MHVNTHEVGEPRPSQSRPTVSPSRARLLLSACLFVGACGGGGREARPGATASEPSGNDTALTTSAPGTDATPTPVPGADAVEGSIAPDVAQSDHPSADDASRPPPPRIVAVKEVGLVGARASGRGPTAPGVPDIALFTLNSYRRHTAQEKNLEGLGDHKKTRSAAVDAYRMALEEDPAHVYARYNLACAYALDEDPRALMLLEQLLAQGSEAAVKLVAQAPNDRDFRAFAKDPRFVELTQGAAATKRAGSFADFEVNPNPPPGWVQIVAAKERGFRLGDRLELSFGSPSLVASVDLFFIEEKPCPRDDCAAMFEDGCGGRGAVQTEKTSPVLIHPAAGLTLSPPVETDKLQLMLDSPPNFFGCNRHSLWLRVLREPTPIPEDHRVERPPREDEPRLAVHDDGTLIIEGFPAVSADGKMVALIGHYELFVDVDQRALHIIERGTDRVLFRRRLAGAGTPDGVHETRFQIDLANKRLRELSPHWRTMLPSGSRIPVSPYGGQSTILGAFDHPRLLVVDLEGRVFHQSRHPRWSVTKGLSYFGHLSSGPEHFGVFVDPLLRTLLYHAEIEHVSAGLNPQEWHVLEMKPVNP